MPPSPYRTVSLAAAALVLTACAQPPPAPTASPTAPTPPTTAASPTTAPSPTATPSTPSPTPSPTATATADPVGQGAWTRLPDAPIPVRLNHTATWTDARVIVWGGADRETLAVVADGAAWDPDTDEWEAIPAAPIEARWGHEAVWTGDELLVWGGTAGPDHLAACFTDGARYDPGARQWQPISAAPGEERCGAAVAWSGEELLVFGGHAGQGPPAPGDRHDDGVAFDPDTGQWRAIPAAPISARSGALGAWVGDELVVYGGHSSDDGFTYTNDGAAYDPDDDAWRELPDSPLPPLVGVHGVAADGRLLVFGGQEPGSADAEPSTATAAYDPGSNTWRELADMPGPQVAAQAQWTGEVVYVLGGAPPDEDPDAQPADGTPTFLAYVPAQDAWVTGPEPPGGPRTNHVIAWTGAELVVWGGQAGEDHAPGARWDPRG